MTGIAQRGARLGVLLVFSFLLVLTACSQAPPATAPDAPAAPTDAGVGTPAAPTDNPDADVPTTAAPAPDLQMLSITTTNGPDENNPAEVARHTQLLEEFKAERPNVEIDARAGGFDREAFVAKLAGGTMEDAYLVAFTDTQAMIEQGYAADITALMQDWEHFASFNPAVLRIVQNQDDRIFGVSVGGYALGLIYNRKLFEEAGLDPDQPPTTWDELREYAQKLTDPSTGRAGFAELSKGNQGGWHFTAWVYSFGGDLQQQQPDGTWTATFNSEPAVNALQTLKAMRWEDQSMTEQQLLEVKDVLPLLATERVAMAIMAPDALRSLKTQYEANIEDFGIGPMPQGGGDATLAGGAAWMFNPQSSPEALQAAFEWTVFRDFNLSAYESDLQGQLERDQLVGWPELPLFTGDFQQQRAAIVEQYANAPLQNYAPYVAATNIQLKPEPPIEAQKLYAILDTVMQTVLTDPDADPQQALDDAVQQFQTQVLDQMQQE
jgi:ABC-type glycerol-3-phosphate transport system substrate-binding protein